MSYSFSKNEEIEHILKSAVFEVADYLNMQDEYITNSNRIGTALSAENNLDKLLEMILQEAKDSCNADGGTLYIMNNDETQLKFSVVKTSSLDISMGGTKGEITWAPLELYHKNGAENYDMVAVKCALKGELIEIKDVYETKKFNFDGTKEFDRKTGFRSKSMIVIPMKNYEGEVIGVCQLINRIDKKKGKIIPFKEQDIEVLSALSSQAAVAITNAQLIKDLRLLLESFIQSIASAIDAKSPYTGGHVHKVAEITMMIAESLNETKDGKYAEIKYDYHQLNEIRISALMHDIGKITTPEYVVDKSTKLETIFDRLEIIKTRYGILERDAKIEYLEKKIEKKEYKDKLLKYKNDFTFLQTANIGGEFMSDDKIERLIDISKHIYISDGEECPLLTEDELKNLSIKKGTLTQKEREIINNHAKVSLDMLKALPFPKKLKRIPEIAGGHHEKLNGKGYPLGLSAKDLSLESRVLALADIFEALTASDRPYKEFKTLSESMKIIDFMVKDGELDADLVQFFYDNNLHVRYAKQELKPAQLDI